MEEERFLIVGLGNPGPRYSQNRHNVGFMCLHQLAVEHGIAFRRRQKRARVASGMICGRSVLLALPQTFMNKSGESVADLVRFYKIEIDHVLVVYDDLDIPQGTIRFRPSGGTGGHRGMNSIVQRLGSRDFPRLRIGIGRPPGRMDPADYVLQDFSSREEPEIEDALNRAMAAIETWLTEGVEATMNQYN